MKFDAVCRQTRNKSITQRQIQSASETIRNKNKRKAWDRVEDGALEPMMDGVNGK